MKVMKTLSIIAVTFCIFVFGQHKTYAGRECWGVTCGSSGIADCLAKYNGDYSTMAANNSHCAKAFEARCLVSCSFDSDNCSSAIPSCPVQNNNSNQQDSNDDQQ